MEPTTLILFGATGDLAKRKIYPALFNLYLDGKLPHAFSLIGLGRREWTDESFRSNIGQSIRSFSRRAANDPAALDVFLQYFGYNVLDVGRKEDYARLLERIERRENELNVSPNRLFYLSVGPEFFGTIAANVRESGLGSAAGWKRLVIEKPFGRDLASARALNESLSQAFAEHEIFRIDHYLGKQVVQKLETIHRTDPALRPLWSGRAIANVQITANETVGVEERAGYYDQSGAIRDMFQNHMLQLLMMTASHLPPTGAAGGPEHDQEREHAGKTRIMQALEPLDAARIGADVVRAQYAAGAIKDQPVVGYAAEAGITPGSANDTFVAARLRLDDPFWRGIPFYIRTGKRLKEKTTRIVVEFKDDGSGAPNLHVFEMSPGESITLQHGSRATGLPVEGAAPIALDPVVGGAEAYETLIGDAIAGDATFFARWSEVELSWQWVQPALEAFAANAVPLHAYAAGTYGPDASDALPAQDGFRWWFDGTPAGETADERVPELAATEI